MRPKPHWMGIIILTIVVGIPLIWAATTATTLFVWNVPAGTHIYTVTYGGSCDATHIYFNEIDANFDPDVDGNAARIKPSYFAQTDGNIVGVDHNFDGITAPSVTNISYFASDSNTGNAPGTIGAINTEASSTEYTSMDTANDAQVTKEQVSGKTIFMQNKTTYHLTVDRAKLYALAYYTQALTFYNAASGCAAGGTETDMNFWVWNYDSNTYQNVGHHTALGGDITSTTYTLDVITLRNDLNSYLSPDNNVTFVITQTQNDGATTIKCMNIDYLKLIAYSYPTSNAFCQSSTVAPITITNGGTALETIDGNFSAAFGTNDKNVVLKVWQGTGSGCGTDGLGGWEADCSVTQAQTAPNTATCRNFNQFNATTNGRLITNLNPSTSQQLCLSGDINAFIRRGQYSETFQVADFNS